MLRELSREETGHVSGGDIVVWGRRSDPFTQSISGEDLANMLRGSPIMNLGIPTAESIPDFSDVNQVPGQAEITLVDVNQDSDYQETLEDAVESALDSESLDDWAVEFDEESGRYVTQSNSGQSGSMSQAEAADIFSQTVA